MAIKTALSTSGHGRIPPWSKAFKVGLLEHNKLSFNQQLFPPFNYYVFGYYCVTHLRRNYGAKAVAAIYEKASRGIPFFGLSYAVKSLTKKSLASVHKDMNRELIALWKQQQEGLHITPATHIEIQNKIKESNCNRPYVDKFGNIIVWKAGFGIRHQLTLLRPLSKPNRRLSNGVEESSICYQDQKVCHTLAPLSPTSLAIGDGCTVWLEECGPPVPNGLVIGGSQVVRLQFYDLKCKKRTTLVKQCRYNAVAISHQANKLVAIESRKAGMYALVILRTKDGKVLKKLDNPDGAYYLTPSWVDKEHIVVVKK